MALGGGTTAAAGRGTGGFLGRSVTDIRAKRFQVLGPKREVGMRMTRPWCLKTKTGEMPEGRAGAGCLGLVPHLALQDLGAQKSEQPGRRASAGKRK